MTEVAENKTLMADSAPPLVCWKVWGGNKRIRTPVMIPGLTGMLHSSPVGSDSGGDVYYMSACGSGAMARLCIADVTGHGAEVSTFSSWLEEVFSAHIHRANPASVFKEVNRRAVRRGLEVMSTGMCFSYNSCNGKLSYCNAGHPPMRICRRGSTEWKPLKVSEPTGSGPGNIPLGVRENAVYSLGHIKLEPGDMLLLHTDGLTEAMDTAGKQLGHQLWAEGELSGSDVLVETITGEIHERYLKHLGGADKSTDDLTYIVLQALPYQQSNKYTLLVKNNINRLFRGQ